MRFASSEPHTSRRNWCRVYVRPCQLQIRSSQRTLITFRFWISSNSIALSKFIEFLFQKLSLIFQFRLKHSQIEIGIKFIKNFNYFSNRTSIAQFGAVRSLGSGPPTQPETNRRQKNNPWKFHADSFPCVPWTMCWPLTVSDGWVCLFHIGEWIERV